MVCLHRESMMSLLPLLRWGTRRHVACLCEWIHVFLLTRYYLIWCWSFRRQVFLLIKIKQISLHSRSYLSVIRKLMRFIALGTLILLILAVA
jgi:hypothetical protein